MSIAGSAGHESAHATNQTAAGLVQDNLVSVLIPTRNEPLVQSLIEDVDKSLRNIPHEIIVIDKSDLLPSLTGARLIIQESKGLGNAILEGLIAARGNWIAVMDGDYSHRPEDLAKLLQNRGGYDFVLGSRYTEGGENQDSLPRRIVSRAFNRLAQTLLGLDIRDPMSGLILARKEVFLQAEPDPIGFKVNMETIYKATRLGFRGTEIPIRFVPRAAGKSKAGISEALRTFYYIISLRFRN